MVGAALLLAGAGTGEGWFLLIPPLGTDDLADEEAPLAKWGALSVYETVEACEAARLKTVDWAQQRIHLGGSLWAYGYARCIASNDPRLL
jgi:hypothetical protein